MSTNVLLSIKPRGRGLKALVDCQLKKKIFFCGFPKEKDEKGKQMQANGVKLWEGKKKISGIPLPRKGRNGEGK